MKKTFKFVSCLVFTINVAAVACLDLSGCATPISPSSRSASKVELHDIEQLQMGTTSSEELKNTFGSPDQVVNLSDTETMWIYRDHQANEPYQRASFVIGRKSNNVLTAA